MKALHLLEGLIFASREPVTEAACAMSLSDKGLSPALYRNCLSN